MTDSTRPPGRRGPSATEDVVARTERVAVLRDLSILDTPSEPAYDDLASLAASVCGSDVGAVNFVDGERHWTKAIVGVEGGQGASVPANLSLCAATIRSEEGAITIGDTLAEGSWQSHPFVTGEPGLRFYAGASIVVDDQPIGVVCVFGEEPREFSSQEKDALAALARQASASLELRGRNDELRKLAITDPLTGLANRTLLFDRFDLALAQKERSDREVGVLFCDVDDFKSVNDRFGHEVGDRLLCEIADRLRDVFRDGDTLARIAGDEFVAVCPELEDLEELEAIVARLARSVAGMDPLPDGSRPPSLTVGAVMAEGGERADETLNRADTAMYAAKPAP